MACLQAVVGHYRFHAFARAMLDETGVEAVVGFQFVHLETYARKPDAAGRSTSFVLAEAARDPAVCLSPRLVYRHQPEGGDGFGAAKVGGLKRPGQVSPAKERDDVRGDPQAQVEAASALNDVGRWGRHVEPRV